MTKAGSKTSHKHNGLSLPRRWPAPNLGNMALVSIVMVCHIDTPFVRPAVRSIFGQSLQDFELVFVNNGSGLVPDEFGEIGHDPRFRWVSLPENLGIAAGLNAGVEAVTGDYVAFLDSDDIALPTRLEKQATLLQRDARLGLVNCGVATIDEQGHMTGRLFVLIDGAEQKVFSAYYSSTITSTFMVRREVAQTFLQRAGFKTAVDYDFLSRVAEQWNLAGVPEILLHYRRHPLQVTVTSRDEQVFNECIVRLITARRRNGEEEELEEIETEFAHWRRSPPPQAVMFAAFARRFLNEGFNTLAVYHARKLLGVKRTPGTALHGLRILGGALARDPGRVFWLLRILLTGPVRAHGLTPF